jgi:putative addiction module killer protein
MRYHVVTTDEFNRWLARIRDRQAAKAIAQRLDRLDRLVAGNLGDVKPVGQGVSELEA